MAVKVIELKGNKAYKKWMEENGDKVEVMDIQSSKQMWNWKTGVLGSAIGGEKDYTVTYKEKSEG